MSLLLVCLQYIANPLKPALIGMWTHIVNGLVNLCPIGAKIKVEVRHLWEFRYVNTTLLQRTSDFTHHPIRFTTPTFPLIQTLRLEERHRLQRLDDTEVRTGRRNSLVRQ